MKSLAILMMSAALSGTASAQVPTSDAAFATQLQGIRLEAAAAGKAMSVAAAQAAAVPTAAQYGNLLSQVLVAMYDAPGTGELLTGWLRDEKKGGAVFNDSLSGMSAGAFDDGVPIVSIKPAPAKPVSYRYLGALIARETAALMLADFPASAEKSYIQASRMAETYFELGGTRMDVDNIDGHQDAEVSKSINLWVENDPTGGVSVLNKQGVPTLAQVRAKAAAEAARLGELIRIIRDEMLVPVPDDPYLLKEMEQSEDSRAAALKTVKACDAAIKAFEAFKQYEKDWLWNHQGMLQ